jgi:hypothetical protein|tara:strand:+ start:154 stop:1149 length:996 start_codon:yes stop_codon:yes gene_type:complete
MECESDMPPPITGQKREWEPREREPRELTPAELSIGNAEIPTVQPDGPSSAQGLAAAAENGAAPAAEAVAPPGGDVAKLVVQPASRSQPTPANTGLDEHAITNEREWLQQQNSVLQEQLAQLQLQHAALLAGQQSHSMAQHAQIPVHAQAQQLHHQQLYAMQEKAAPQQQCPPVAQTLLPATHNPAWTAQINPENGLVYYWNQTSGESTYTRPPDCNPSTSGVADGANTLQISGGSGSSCKGPPGANLFIVRKMRRGEYDAFTDEDLKREFGKYGTVMRSEMTIDKETGWSKGFGFVSFASPQEADAAINAVHGSWMAGREMKVEKTNEDR